MIKIRVDTTVLTRIFIRIEVCNINEANELLDAIEILAEKSAKNNAVIYSGIVTEISTSVCTMKINGNTYSNIAYYGGTPIVGNTYRVFVPFGNMSQAFTLIFADTSTGESGVQLVNGKTGGVVLTAADVGAISTSNMSQTLGVSTTKVPSEKAVSDALSAAGAGDMLKSVYDSDNSVANSGGIADYVANHSPEVFICTISGAGTSASPFTCDKTTAQIYEAAQAGKQVYVVSNGIFCSLSFVSEHTNRFTKVTSTDTIDGMQGYATLVTVRSDGKVSVKETGLEQTSNKVNTISASSTTAEYPSANAVWNAIPHPEAKTDAMTQAVGKDADGKLWTAPGGGSGGGGSAFSLIRSLTLTEQTDRVDITTGDGGSAFALTEVYVAVEAQSYTETAEAVIFLPNGLWTSNNPYITSSNKTTKASETWKNGMTFHAACLGNQMAFAEQCPTKGNNNNLESKIGTIGGAAITKISLISKLTAGCTVTVYGR